MTTEIGNFERTQWVATYCSSGGIVYYPLGADSQPIWEESTWIQPQGDNVTIKFPEGYAEYVERKNSGVASYGISASFVV